VYPHVVSNPTYAVNLTGGIAGGVYRVAVVSSGRNYALNYNGSIDNIFFDPAVFFVQPSPRGFVDLYEVLVAPSNKAIVIRVTQRISKWAFQDSIPVPWNLPGQSVTTVIGNGTASSTDGYGIAALVNGPSAMCLSPNGELVYFYDAGTYKLRKFSILDYKVTTVAGSGARGFADGTGSGATFFGVTHIAFGPDGHMYVADFRKIRRVTIAGVVTTVAGTGFGTGLGGSGPDGTNANPLAADIDPRYLGFTKEGDCHFSNKMPSPPFATVTRKAAAVAGIPFAGPLTLGVTFSGGGSPESYGGIDENYGFMFQSGYVHDYLQGITYRAVGGAVYTSPMFCFGPDKSFFSYGTGGGNFTLAYDTMSDESAGPTTLITNPTGHQDGLFASARFNNFVSMVRVAENRLLIADTQNNRIKLVTL
jgi:hypothetical protein